MPSKSDKQKRFFDWMAHDKEAAIEHGIKPEVACEWHNADMALKKEQERKEENPNQFKKE